VDGSVSETLGHEAVGIIADTSGRSSFKPGDRVIVMPENGCGTCTLCLAGEHIHCEHPINALAVAGSSTGRATYAQYCIQQEHLLLRIPDDISDDHAAMALCALGPTFNAMQKMQVHAGETVLISGLGAVGLGGVINAVARGARVIALEMHPYRTKLALSLGAEAVIDPKDPGALKHILALTNDRGADASVETSSAPDALSFIAEATQRMGRIAIVGWAGSIIGAQLVKKGLTVFGAWHWNHLRDAEAMFTTIRRSRALLDRFITHRFPMSRIEDAWTAQRSGECGKILVDPWQ
ncbi:MAG: zinc-binding dehydrogenase, partial [Spirochaetota bacterium]